MGATLKPETEARISDLARRLGFAGPNDQERVIEMALDSLDAKTPRQCHQMSPEEVAAEYRVLSAAGRRWREENPGEYDENNPPSKTWQDELYDERGLPE